MQSLSSLSCVDGTPCNCCCICLFHVLGDSRKCFAMAVAVSIGQEAKNPAFIALSQIDFVQNPDTPW